ncbi:hypothetical protein F5Y16DRAFT_239033 [Xylariaceae sp. FL0255]|nr:hypothetical protein F5Y16DRAFT_239033 [Xylariaceae sp. FL0255]
MDDCSSIASFEEVAPSGVVIRSDDRFSKDAGTFTSAGEGGSSPEPDAEDPPDVLYVLQFKEFGNQIEVRRSAEPIDVSPGQTTDATKGKKPVLEIVTIVSTSFMQKKPPHPCPPDPYYVGHPGFPGRPPMSNWRHEGNRLENELKVTKVENKVMVVHSLHLRNALQAVIGYYPGTSFIGDEVKIEAPYYALVHYREALARYKYQQPESHDEEYASMTAKHIDILLSFLEKTLGDQIREEEKRYDQITPSATFDLLWLLMKPGEVIYTQHDGHWAPFIVSRIFKKTSSSPDGQFSYAIDCWNYMHTGRAFHRMMHCFDIPPFSGEEAIDRLPVVPARFFRGEDRDKSSCQVWDEEIRQGKLVWDLCKGPSYKQYDGEMVKKMPNAGIPWSPCPTGYMNGRVIIDCGGYERYSKTCPTSNRNRDYGHPPPVRPAPPFDQLPHFAPCCGCAACNHVDRIKNKSQWAEFLSLNPEFDAAPDLDLYYLVLSKVVAGFMLGERRWGHFHVESLQNIQFDKDAFNSLVLDNDVKNTLRAMIGKFSSKDGHVSAWPNDFVKNKGQGRIFLLHGSPGVGKTCTAECVAELTHRPLLSLTSGDLSTSSSQVERNLEYFLQLGERFGAMVLLDEADVYLESRRAKDIARNGLVSVFLRALEYYRGVLFLTTNRVQTFDAAFTSRIHVALHYGPLTDSDRERIWITGFERLERDAGGRVRVAMAARTYVWRDHEVRKLRWNGREIRNALQTAVALAESEALDMGAQTVFVTERHLQSVVRMSRGFKNFMNLRLRDEEYEGDGEALDTEGSIAGDDEVGDQEEEEDCVDEEGDEDDEDESIELSGPPGYRYPPSQDMMH